MFCFGFYNVLFLAHVLRVLMHEFTYDQPTPLNSEVQRSLQERCSLLRRRSQACHAERVTSQTTARKGVEKQAHAVVRTAASRLQNIALQ